MACVDQQTLKDLEFDTIREWLSSFAFTPTIEQKLKKLSPINDFNAIDLALKQTEELRQIKITGETFPALFFEELNAELKYLKIKNAVLSLEGYMRIHQASNTVNQLLVFFDKRENEYPLLNQLLGECEYTEEIILLIEKVFDRTGQVKDDASPTLAEIRQNIKILKNQINKNFEKEVRRLLKENILGETKETFINDRRVLTILSSHKRKVSGNVVGSSKTGSLTFIEPGINIPLNNELELLQDDERKEIYRILQVLTSHLQAFYPLIQAYQYALSAFDFIQAKTKLALEMQACLPGIAKEIHIELIDAFHPLLRKNNEALKKKTIPQFVRLDKTMRMLVISGPNAGGKSITLKTVGLLQVMLQAGLLVPVNSNSKMCFFQQILSDIGDNQSIENELSTYSYRLQRMRHFLKISNHRSLLLLDEFGTGSDPELGGALAEVFFEELYQKKSFGVITTHYSNIKLKADQLKNAINGSMLFDTDTLLPKFQFSIGQPGSSFTFEVAQMNGIPSTLIEKAKTKLDENKIKLDHLLHDLQKQKTYLENLKKEYIDAQALAQKAEQKHKDQTELLNQKITQYKANNEKVTKLGNYGQKLQVYVQRFNAQSRKKDINKLLLEDISKWLFIEKNKILNEQQKEKDLKVQKSAVKTKKKEIKEKKQEDLYQQAKIKVGSKVKLIETKQSGTVQSINGNSIEVNFGFIRMKVEREKLMHISD